MQKYHPVMDFSEEYIAKIRENLDKPLEKIVIKDNEFSDLEDIFKMVTEIEFDDNEVKIEECELSLDEILDRELGDKTEDKLDNDYELPRIP